MVLAELELELGRLAFVESAAPAVPLVEVLPEIEPDVPVVSVELGLELLLEVLGLELLELGLVEPYVEPVPVELLDVLDPVVSPVELVDLDDGYAEDVLELGLVLLLGLELVLPYVDPD